MGVELVWWIKVVASRLAIGHRTFYDRVNRGAELVYVLSRGIAQTRAAFVAVSSTSTYQSIWRNFCGFEQNMGAGNPVGVNDRTNAVFENLNQAEVVG